MQPAQWSQARLVKLYDSNAGLPNPVERFQLPTLAIVPQAAGALDP